MTYLDTSVALAHLLAEDRPSRSGVRRSFRADSWSTRFGLVSTTFGLARSHAKDVRDMLGRVAFVELTPLVLERALEPFPVPVRTLDAIHLASVDFLGRTGRRCV